MRELPIVWALTLAAGAGRHMCVTPSLSFTVEEEEMQNPATAQGKVLCHLSCCKRLEWWGWDLVS